MKERYFILSDFTSENLADFTLGELKAVKRESLAENSELLDSFDWLLWRSGFVLLASASALTLCGDSCVTEARKSKAITYVKDMADGNIKETLKPVMGQRVFIKKADCQTVCSMFDVLNTDDKTVARFEILNIDICNDTCRYAASFLKTIPLKGYLREDSLVQASVEDSGGARIKIQPFCYALKKSGIAPASYKTKITAEGLPDSPVELEIKDICARLLGVMEINEDGAMDGRDPEFLHDYRVALRRMRSCVAMLKGIIPQERLDHIRSMLADLFAATGSLRDLDVYLEHMAEYAESLPNDMKKSLAPVVSFLRREQKRERRKLTKLFESAQYAETKNAVRLFLASEITEEGKAPVNIFAAAAVRKAYGRIVKKASLLHASSEAAEIHNIRVLCKKLRYSLEFFDVFFPEKERELAGQRLKRLQDSLGAHQDYEVQREKLLAYSAEAANGAKDPLILSVAVGYLVRLLDEKQQAEREKALMLINDFISAKMRKIFKDMTSL